MQAGTTKDQVLYSKPSAAVNPGALAAGTLPQYYTIVVLLVSGNDLVLYIKTVGSRKCSSN